MANSLYERNEARAGPQKPVGNEQTGGRTGGDEFTAGTEFTGGAPRV